MDKRINFSLTVVFATGAFMLIAYIGAAATQITGGTWLDYAFTADQTARLMEGYNRVDILRHRWMTTNLDLMLPIILAGFAISIFYYCLPKRPRDILVALAVMGSVADYMENALIVSLLDGGDQYGIKATLTTAKFALILIPQFVALYLFLKQLKTRLLTRQ